MLDLPAVHVGGWYDIHLDGILGNFTGMRGPAAVLDVTAMRQDWFRAWLQDGPEPGWAPVRLFVMGENAWRDEQEWPLARTRYESWYLQPGGGQRPGRPADGGAADEFTHDPADPVPTIGGRLLGVGEFAGPYDQRAIGDRADVLAYTSAPAPLEPGAVHQFTIDLVATGIVLPAGHRLRVHVSSSSFPEREPTPGTGAPLGTDTDADLRVARQSVYHGSQPPSRLIRPAIPP